MARKGRPSKPVAVEQPRPRDLINEEKAIHQIETSYLQKEPPSERVCMFDDLPVQWEWDQRKIRKLRELWESGFHPKDIATILQINQLSVELCLWWQAEIGKIEYREGGAYGTDRG